MQVLGNPNEIKAPYLMQGDCILKKVGIFGLFEKEYVKIPDVVENVQGNLLLKGNTNSHALYGGRFQMYKADGVIFLDVKETTVLDHVKDLNSNAKAEHHAQYVPPGQYFLDELLEFDHLLEESRRVID